MIKKQSPRTKSPQSVDSVVGGKIKARRIALKKSQSELAAAIGVTFQQIQKYERGLNRISLSRLIAICEALNVKPEFFIGDSTAHKNSREIEFFSMSADAIQLVQSYSKISDSKLRKQILKLAQSLSGDHLKD